MRELACNTQRAQSGSREPVIGHHVQAVVPDKRPAFLLTDELNGYELEAGEERVDADPKRASYEDESDGRE